MQMTDISGTAKMLNIWRSAIALFPQVNSRLASYKLKSGNVDPSAGFFIKFGWLNHFFSADIQTSQIFAETTKFG